MRRHAIVSAVLLIGAACGQPGESPGSAGSPPPSASQQVTAPPAPVEQGTVTNNQTAFLVRLASVRAAGDFASGGQSEKAASGERLIVVKIHITNTGKQPSQLEIGNSNPVSLVDTRGKTHDTDVSFSSGDTIKPDESRVETYVFHLPNGAKPDMVLVALVDANGVPSTVSLKVP